MIRCIAHNISSPLGWNTAQNFAAVQQGVVGLRLYEDKWGIEEPFVASLFPENAVSKHFSRLPGHISQPYSRFEQLAILSISQALKQTNINPESTDTVFILASTKGNIELLDPRNQPDIPRERVRLGATADVIARFFNHTGTPLVVSNACISGVHAQILAQRLLETHAYRYAVVCGCDVQSKFIVSGFQSFQALSPFPCKPFDKNRTGLNLGEAAATMILASTDAAEPGAEVLHCGAIRNDANHISGPSRTAEGSFRALQTVCTCDTSQLAFVNVHGTATPYNDEMEAIALERAGLLAVPANALKGFFGHTMGAAGVLETVLSLKALETGIVLPVKGFQEIGVSRPITLVRKPTPTDKRQFVKLLSGFGGCNAAVRWEIVTRNLVCQPPKCVYDNPKLSYRHRVHITQKGISLDQRPITLPAGGDSLITALYKDRVGHYPKFYKMDALSKLGFVAAELLLQQAGEEAPKNLLSRAAIVLTGRSGSLSSDEKYQQTICNENNYFPSPAVFVYTLPNIVTGEIAIRHGIHGETAFYLLEKKNEELISLLAGTAFCDRDTSMVIGGWLEYEHENSFEADLYLYGMNNEKAATAR